MRILAFDTATRATAVALADEHTTLEGRDDPPPGERPGHARRLLGLIDQLMAEAGVGWEAIDRIAVGLGPGTFTGLRIGVATAKALARASGAEVVGVSSLQALAQNARLLDAAEIGVVLAVLDARRGEVYAGAWDPGRPTDPPLLAPRALSPESLVMAAGDLGANPLAIGEGAIAFREVLEHGGLSVPNDGAELHRITAAGHCLIARHLLPVAPDELAPDYHRLPDAQPRSTVPTGPERPDGH